MKDLLDNYQPDILYFDGTLPFKNIGMDIGAHFYNSNTRWNNGSFRAVLNLKTVPEGRRDSCAFNIERGVAGDLEEHPWQTDSCIGAFYYKKETEYKTPEQVIHMLADIVSKNGNLLLSIPQREDGSLDEKEISILEEIADWMSINKEAIHGTRPWSIFTEGPIRAVGGAKKERQPLLSLEGAPRTEEQERYGYTPRDIRFTTKGNSLYAILLGCPLEELVITSLPTSTRLWFGTIKKVELLGSKQDLTWKQDKVGLRIEMQKEKPCNHAYVIKISG